MQQADVRVGALHDFAVHLQHQAQHAVRGRVLRAEVQRVVADFRLAHGLFPCVPSAAACCQRESWRITRGTLTRGSMLTGS